LPFTATDTAMLGDVGSVARPVLSLPLAAQLSYANSCSPRSTSTTESLRDVVHAKIYNRYNLLKCILYLYFKTPIQIQKI